MFRKMRRFKQQITDKQCIEVLKNAKRYGLPINQWYCEEDGKIYFHGAKEGHKIDAIKACDKVSFCTWDEGYQKDDDWALNINSVIVFGRIKLVEDEDTAIKICTNLTKKFTDDEEYLQKELKNALPRVQCLELIPDNAWKKRQLSSPLYRSEPKQLLQICWTIPVSNHL